MSKKIKDSRLLRLALIAIFILAGMKLLSFAFIAGIIFLIKSETVIDKISAYENIIKILSMPIAGPIAAIITALAVRYGAREATSNLGSKQGGK